ncbi:uncharacterized protein C8orf48 homolog [Orycteropus afer afer]|uniref:Uncharacterized protein C8orf48 homolog n=1 Tax=Orycteropus afer afer TaxID=1230840 RepID=A0A8B7AHV0_ORYAF|nr:uncharacterized protein C8orf48 homolog [Orycteropus afer afer]
MTDISGETFEPFTDEVESSDSFCASGGQQPWLQASESKAESSKQTTISEHQDKESELSDFKNNEKRLSRKWINHLKSNKTNYGQYQYQPDTKFHKEIVQVSEKELNAVQSFCTAKINLIHRRVNYKEAKSSRSKKIQLKSVAEDPVIDPQKCTVPDELLNRIYLKNLRATLKQMSATKQHISSQCHNCNRKRAELAQFAFVKQKKILLESLLLQQKVDEHLHTKDFLTFIGEAHKDFPRLSDDPRLIWKRLTKKSQIGCSDFEKSDTEQKI